MKENCFRQEKEGSELGDPVLTVIDLQIEVEIIK